MTKMNLLGSKFFFYHLNGTAGFFYSLGLKRKKQFDFRFWQNIYFFLLSKTFKLVIV